MVVLATVVGVALAGSRTGDDPVALIPSALPAGSPDVSPSAAPPGAVEIGPREVVVRGRVSEALGDVRIMLQSSTGQPIATAAIDPTGGGHADWIPFESRFRLSLPAQGGEWPAFIVAVDRDGTPIEPFRHRFSNRAYVSIPSATGPAVGGRPDVKRHGEDGVMGGIPFGTNFRTGS
jgi:hypothetical protein